MFLFPTLAILELQLYLNTGLMARTNWNSNS